MSILLYLYIFLGVLSFFIKVAVCLTNEANDVTTILPPNATRRTRSSFDGRVLFNQTLGNRTLGPEELCMPETCGAVCMSRSGLLSGGNDTEMVNNSINSFRSINKNFAVETFPKNQQRKRYLMQDPPNPEIYVSLLARLTTEGGHWLQTIRSGGGTSTRAFQYDLQRPHYQSSVGVKGLYGCTAVVIASNAGVFASYIWEIPIFRFRDGRPQTYEYFDANVFDVLADGNPTDAARSVGFRTLLGQGAMLSDQMRPVIFIITPYTTDRERRVLERLGIATRFRYQGLVNRLAAQLRANIPSRKAPQILGYERPVTEQTLDGESGVGKAIVEVDQALVEIRQGRRRIPGIKGSWRLWYEEQIIFEQHYSYPRPMPD